RREHTRGTRNWLLTWLQGSLPEQSSGARDRRSAYRATVLRKRSRLLRGPWRRRKPGRRGGNNRLLRRSACRRRQAQLSGERRFTSSIGVEQTFRAFESQQKP